MEYPPMKFAEARHLCDSYRFLEGELLCKAGCQRYYIRCVAVSPFDKLNKWIFTQFYLESGDEDESLNFYTFPDFDVILIGYEPGSREVVYKDLHIYLAEQVGLNVRAKELNMVA